ncbi:MAG: DNA sulfur modification protein DndD, partial [Candidatus Zixiibacteriota bacterium]
MIIRQVHLSNFGIYRGDQSFNLTPVPLNGYSRPIVLFRGKNGAGKTTLVEAIRLCLHGSLALGSRISRAKYENYLAKRIHIPQNSAERPASAQISLTMDYISELRKQTYHIQRSWQLTPDQLGEVTEALSIWENGQRLSEFDSIKQKESFLRELVPPQVTNLLFFDGEKLRLLAEDGTSSSLLAEAINMLLGLHLVGRLQKDLDIFLSRKKTEHSSDSLQAQLQELTQRISDLENKRSNLQIEQRVIKESISAKQHAISNQEQRIASEGKWFADRLNDLKATRQQLEAEIEVQRRRAQDLCNGLLPFAVAPQMCRLVADRLHLEKEYKQGMTSQQVLENQLAQVSTAITSPEFWVDIGVNIDGFAQHKVREKIERILREAVPDCHIDPAEVIVRVSDEDWQTLLVWIDQALAEVPREFCRTVSQLNHLEAEIEQVDQELELVPADEALEPLVETLHRYSRELVELQTEDQELDEQIQRVDYELEQSHLELRRLRERIAEREHLNQRIQLANKTQRVLEEYSRELRREKIALLEKALVVRFNQLCRKESLIDAARIDPDTYEITLFRQQQPVERKQLSAGEKQLLAVATMWGLREVSGAPMPVVIDTPLGRLDSDHRLNMIQDYFPRAGHQVILLTTDTEIDDHMLSRLAPAISRIYHLDYDPAHGKTKV